MLILDEKIYVENILSGDEVGCKPSSVISLLARYYYHCKSITNEPTLEKLINEFMSENYVEYNSVKWSNTVSRYIKQAPNYPIHRIEGLNIYQSELDIVNELKEEKDRLIVFSMLCYAKYNNLIRPDRNNNWCNAKEKDFFSVARVTARSKQDRKDRMKRIMRYLNNVDGDNESNPNKEERIILTGKIDKINFRLPFVVNEFETNSEPVFKVLDLTELGYEYLNYYNSEKFDRCGCENCKVLFRQNKNNPYTYCLNHRKKLKGKRLIKCECCGKIFEPSSNAQTRCTDCVIDNGYSKYEKVETKIIKCIDCGKEFEIDAKATKQERCPECYKIYRKEKNKIAKEKWKNKNKS